MRKIKLNCVYLIAYPMIKILKLNYSTTLPGSHVPISPSKDPEEQKKVEFPTSLKPKLHDTVTKFPWLTFIEDSVPFTGATNPLQSENKTSSMINLKAFRVKLIVKIVHTYNSLWEGCLKDHETFFILALTNDKIMKNNYLNR